MDKNKVIDSGKTIRNEILVDNLKELIFINIVKSFFKSKTQSRIVIIIMSENNVLYVSFGKVLSKKSNSEI